MKNLKESMNGTNLLVAVTGFAWMGVFVAAGLKVYGVI
jgi:hypothetical protein